MRTRNFTLLLVLLLSVTLTAQDSLKKNYQFEMLYKVKTTPVKSQHRTGTCWDYATTSFMETELLREGKGEFDLSEMYIVRMAYPEKADLYVRFHGKENFSEGGQAHDFMNVLRNYGIVPQSVYNGNIVDPKTYNHREVYSEMNAMLNAVLKQAHPTDKWEKAIAAVLDVYLGKPPKEFEYNDETFTPKSFLNYLGFIPDDYVEISSFTHHPFYSKFVLEVPDNWSHDEYYNVPIDDLIKIMKYALKNGYSVDWDGDIGREYFRRDGIAIVPENIKDLTYPVKEKKVTQELRQKEFNNFQTTDDHLMHITGLAKEKSGTIFFYTKNSWGTKPGYDGFWYMSEPYVRLKTIAIMVNKNSVPKEIREKLKF